MEVNDKQIDTCAFELFRYERPYSYVGQWGLVHMDYYDVSEEVRETYRNKVRVVLKTLEEERK